MPSKTTITWWVSAQKPTSSRGFVFLQWTKNKTHWQHFAPSLDFKSVWPHLFVCAQPSPPSLPTVPHPPSHTQSSSYKRRDRFLRWLIVGQLSRVCLPQSISCISAHPHFTFYNCVFSGKFRIDANSIFIARKLLCAWFLAIWWVMERCQSVLSAALQWVTNKIPEICSTEEAELLFWWKCPKTKPNSSQGTLNFVAACFVNPSLRQNDFSLESPSCFCSPL